MTLETLLPVFLQNVDRTGAPREILDRIYKKYYLSESVKRFLNRYFDEWYAEYLKRNEAPSTTTSAITIDLTSSRKVLGKRKFVDLTQDET